MSTIKKTVFLSLGLLCIFYFNNCSQFDTSKSISQPVESSLVDDHFANKTNSLSDSTLEQNWIPGRLLVQPQTGLSESEFEKVIKPIGAKEIRRIGPINLRVLQLPPQASEKAVEALLRRNPHIKYAERDRLVKPTEIPNDPYYSNAWHLPKVGAVQAWDATQGEGITVAILDSGVDSNHPDLVGQLVPGRNFMSNTSDTSDIYGHGTRVAGTEFLP